MAITGKYIQDCMQNVAKLTMNFSLNCMKNHPYVSFTSIFLLLLYLCFPWLFWLMIYLASFLSLAAATAKIYFSFSNAKTSGKDEKKNDSNTVNPRRLVRNDVNARSVRKRRSKEPSRDDSVQTKEEEKTTVFSSTFDNVTVDKSALIEENPKEIREVEVDLIVSRGESSTTSLLRSLRTKKLDAGKGDRESDSSDSTEDERDKEENKKAVQWSEDDQKNLMDLGLSEIERNKRLESLIARRRARKLLSLQVRRTLMNMDRNVPFPRINPIAVPRNNPFTANPPSGQFSPMPSSAPSVMIPMHNPFDLPYDPQEEKPILTGGSFHQEFLPVLQKDMFCRHESFTRGPYITGELNQDEQDASWHHDAVTRRRSSEHEKSKLENQLDKKDTDKVVEVESSQPPKSDSDIAKDYVFVQDIQSPEPRLDSNNSHQEEETEEVQTKLMLVNDSSGHASSTSSSELDEPFSRIDRDAILESLASYAKRNVSARRDSRSHIERDSGLSSFDKNKMEDRYFFPHRAISHIPTCSIASDLQVEVSEVSSPRLTIDGSISPHDEVPSCEENVDRGIPSSSEDIWAASSHACSGEDENESRLRDIHEVGVHNAVEIGFSGTQRSEDPVAKQKVDEKMIEEGTNLYSQSISTAELHDGSQEQTSGLNSSSQENFQTSAGSDSSNVMPSETLAFPAFEKPPQPPRNRESDKLEKLNTNNLVFAEEDIGDDILIRERGRPPTEWSITSSPTSIGYPESQCELIEDHRNTFDYYQPHGENNNPNASEDFGGESINMPGHEQMHHSMSIEHDTPESVQVNDHEQQTSDELYPEVNESFRSHHISQLVPRLMVQRVPIASLPSPSPRSVLQPKFSMNHRSLSNLSEEMPMEIQHLNSQIAESDDLDEPRGESLTYNESHNTTLSMDDSASHRFQNTDAEISQESSNPSTTSTMETKSTGSTSKHKTEGSTESLTSPESTAGQLKPEEETSYRILEENHERSEELHDHEHEGNSKALDSNKKMEELADTTELEKQLLSNPVDENKSGLDKPDEAASRSDTAFGRELHGHEHEGNSKALDSNKKMEELADTTELEKQESSKPVDESKSGLDKPDEAASRSDTADDIQEVGTADDIKEVGPAEATAEDIRPNNHILLAETKEEQLKSPGSSIEEGIALST